MDGEYAGGDDSKHYGWKVATAALMVVAVLLIAWYVGQFLMDRYAGMKSASGNAASSSVQSFIGGTPSLVKDYGDPALTRVMMGG